jgi:CheY-like chemotaxis protein
VFTILQRSGMVVDTAKNGAEALKRLANCRYALILLDLMMPVMTGWEVLDQLAKEGPDRRPLVLVFTAGTEPRDVSPELVIGSIRKPFDVTLLHDMVAACLSAVTAQQQLRDCLPSESDAKRMS